MKYTKYSWGIRKTSENFRNDGFISSDFLKDLIDAYVIVDKVTGFKTVTTHIDTHINSDYEVYGAMWHEDDNGCPILICEVIFTEEIPEGELLYGRK